jgi:hypothetical protein
MKKKRRAGGRGGNTRRSSLKSIDQMPLEDTKLWRTHQLNHLTSKGF